MPEGDTAHRAARDLNRALAGRTVTRSELRVPALAAASSSLLGEVISGVDARGKHVLMRVGEHTLHSHFGMDGTWRILHSPRDRWPAAHRVRAVLGTNNVTALGVELARLDLWPTADEESRLGWLGPDLLAASPDLAEAASRVGTDPGREITAALLDQRNVSGLGNVYVTEMCFIRGVLPSRLVADAGDPAEWIRLGRRLMLANWERRRVFTGDTRNATWVYGRAGKPCLRCGTTIVGGEHASGSSREGTEERVSAWCPHCQT